MEGATKYDAIIIGSGQAGTPLALALAEAGRKTALIERIHVGQNMTLEELEYARATKLTSLFRHAKEIDEKRRAIAKNIMPEERLAAENEFHNKIIFYENHGKGLG